jgi:ubiquitin-conjugating enzyme E2 R
MVSGEDAGERWSPAQRAETVLISILSLLDDPEISSPANVDASVQYRDHKEEFKQRVQEEVEKSKKDIPEGFVMPTHESTKPPIEDKPDEDFWIDSDAEDLDLDDFDFDDDAANGSESDEALNNDSEDEEDFEDSRDDDTAKLDVTPKAKAKGKGKAESEENDAQMTDVE